MPSIRIAFFAAALALAAVPQQAAHAQAQIQGQSTVAAWRGGRNEQLIDQAVRRYGFRPNRLTGRQVDAIHRAWDELLGTGRRRAVLNRTQATAIVYMALVQPYEDERAYDRRGDDDRYDRDDRAGYWGAECDQMEADAYRLGNLVAAPARNSGLFVAEPERGRARTLARQIQERAVACRATAAADRAGEVLRLLSDQLPDRDDVSRRVDALKLAIQQASPGRGRR